MRYLRAKKAALREQYRLVPGHGYVPVCPYCWDELGLYRAPSDGHHYLVKKGDVQGWNKSERELIHHPINIVVLCHSDHMAEGQTSDMTRWCIRYKLRQGWTIQQMQEWLDSLPFKEETDRYGYLREYLATPDQILDPGANQGCVRDLAGWGSGHSLSACIARDVRTGGERSRT